MTPDDVTRIEQSLQIELPGSYKRLVEQFPVPAYAGNTDTAIWDDADKLIQCNKELRAGSAHVAPWPAHFFALGRDDSGCAQAIDLRTGELWWADHSHLDAPGSYKHAESFEEWAKTYLDGLRDDLAGDGGEPTATPQQRVAFEARTASDGARMWGWVVLFIAVLVILWRWLS